MNREEIDVLVNKYWPEFTFQIPEPDRRYEDHSSSQCYALVREFKPKACLEFGTSKGGATCVIMAALVKNKKEDNLPFRFITSELLPELTVMAADNIYNQCRELPVMCGKIEDNLWIIPKGRELDFVFIDTDHDLENTKWYITNILPRIKTGGLVAIHDWAVRESDGGLVGKGPGGVGGWTETNYVMELISKGQWPLEKLYWNYEEGNGQEGSFWIKK